MKRGRLDSENRERVYRYNILYDEYMFAWVMILL